MRGDDAVQDGVGKCGRGLQGMEDDSGVGDVEWLGGDG